MNTPEASAFERGVRPVLEVVPTEQLEAILRFRPSADLQQRIDELAEKSTEGTLTAEERSEFEGYVRANKFVAILKRQAQEMVGSAD